MKKLTRKDCMNARSALNLQLRSTTSDADNGPQKPIVLARTKLYEEVAKWVISQIEATRDPLRKIAFRHLKESLSKTSGIQPTTMVLWEDARIYPKLKDWQDQFNSLNAQYNHHAYYRRRDRIKAAISQIDALILRLTLEDVGAPELQAIIKTL